MSAIQNLVKVAYRDKTARELLSMPVGVLIGVDAKAKEALNTLDVESVLDLALSQPFNTAANITQLSSSQSFELLEQYGVPADRVSNELAGMTPDQLRAQDISVLDDISAENRDEIAQATQSETIHDFALWPPFKAAQQIMNAVVERQTMLPESDTPAELLPEASHFPADAVYYEQVVLDEIVSLAAEAKPLVEPIDMLADADQEKYFKAPALGAIMTFSQVYRQEGVKLGAIVASVNLAPGESTKVAITNWQNQRAISVTEDLTQAEQLSNSQSNRRAISELQNAIAEESTSGFSKVSSESKSGGGGGGFGLNLGVVSIGGSGSGSKQKSKTRAVSTSSGRRRMGSQFLQRINQSTRQNAASLRQLTSATVQEVNQQEEETNQTRILVNPNRDKPLTLQYWEIDQVLRTTLRLLRCERAIFVPLKPFDFSDERIINRFRTPLLEAALTPYVEDLIAQSTGKVNFKMLGRKALQDPDARLFQIQMVNGWQWVERLQLYLDGAEEPLTFEVDGSAAIELDLEPTASRILKIRATFKSPPPIPYPFVVYFNFKLGDKNSTLATSFPLHQGIGTITLLESKPPVESQELADLLNEEVLYYSQAIWQSLDAQEAALLLNPYTFNGKRLIEHIDPIPLTTYGNYVVFRYNFDGEGLTPDEINALPEEQRQEIEAWQAWKAKHADFTEVDEQLITVPTGALHLEAVQGRSHAAEKLDITRNWSWYTPAAPEIAPLDTGSRAIAETITPGRFDAPIINITNPQSLPDPQGTSALLSALATPNLFRNSTGLESAIAANAQALQTTANSTLTQASIASQNFQAALGATSQSGLSSSNPAYVGAMLNEAEKLDRQQGGFANFPNGNGSSGATNGSGSSLSTLRGNSSSPVINRSLRADTYRAAVNPAFAAADAAAQVLPASENALPSSENAQPVGFTNELSYWLPILLHRPKADDIQRLQEKFRDDLPDQVPYGWPLQLIENGTGVVTFDRFSLEIAKFPTVSERELDPKSLVRFIRLRLNDFINKRLTEFEPYDEEEASLWKKSDPTGSLVGINAAGPDDFAVVCTGATDTTWTFTTCWTPRYWSHPLSGVRMFGLEQNPATGKYEFFTAAADRPTMHFDDVTSPLAQLLGTALWESLLDGVETFVNKYDGEASNKQKTKFRAEWSAVQHWFASTQTISV
jgi:hypothetical protein